MINRIIERKNEDFRVFSMRVYNELKEETDDFSFIKLIQKILKLIWTMKLKF